VADSCLSNPEIRFDSLVGSSIFPLSRSRTVQAGPGAADTSIMITLVCRVCGGVLQFGADGWEHRDSVRPCDAVLVAWPPPDEGHDEDHLSAAG